MDTLLPALVAALLSQAIGRSAWLTAILADRYGRPFTVAIAALVAHGAGQAIAGVGGALIAAMLTPNARQLLLALALAFAALGAFGRVKVPDRLQTWRLGVWLTPLLGIFILALGDSSQFITLVFAANGSPALAAIGGTIGSFAVSLAAALMGERQWRRLPLLGFGYVLGAVTLAAAAILAASALRLI